MKILVLGGNGLLGTSFLRWGKTRKNLQLVGVGRHASNEVVCDVMSFTSVVEIIESHSPEVIVNLVSQTSVDMCEKDKKGAFLSNITPVLNLVAARELASRTFRIMHISTDHVYSSEGLSDETDIAFANNYALTKYQSEKPLDLSIDVVLRTNFFGKSHSVGRESFSDWLASGLLQRKTLPVFTDVFFNPVSMTTLFEVMEFLLENGVTGTYNIGASSSLSKADFAGCFADCLGLERKYLREMKVADATWIDAPRPRDMRMSIQKFSSQFDYTLPKLESEILSVSKEYEVAK